MSGTLDPLPDALITEQAIFAASSFGVAFTVYGTPQPGGSKRGFATKSRRVIITDANPKVKPWQARVEEVAGTLMQGRPLFDGPLVLQATFFRKRPKGHYGKHGVRPAAPRWPSIKPDTTKLVRALEDALTGIVWRDDAQIVDQVVAKRYGEPERVEVQVRIRMR